MKEIYENNILERVKKELKLQGAEIRLEVSKYGEKITADGIEYFDKVINVDIFYQFTRIGTYEVESKKLYTPKHVGNVVAIQALVKMANDYLGVEAYEVDKKLAEEFASFVENTDPNCDMSDYELAELFRFGK